MKNRLTRENRFFNKNTLCIHRKYPRGKKKKPLRSCLKFRLLPILTGKGKGFAWQFMESKWLLGNINGPLEEKVRMFVGVVWTSGIFCDKNQSSLVNPTSEKEIYENQIPFRSVFKRSSQTSPCICCFSSVTAQTSQYTTVVCLWWYIDSTLKSREHFADKVCILKAIVFQ